MAGPIPFWIFWTVALSTVSSIDIYILREREKLHAPHWACNVPCKFLCVERLVTWFLGIWGSAEGKINNKITPEVWEAQPTLLIFLEMPYVKVTLQEIGQTGRLQISFGFQTVFFRIIYIICGFTALNMSWKWEMMIGFRGRRWWPKRTTAFAELELAEIDRWWDACRFINANLKLVSHSHD